MSNEQALEHHYARPNLLQLILDGLRELGKDPDNLQPKDLSAVDEFHIRGWEATAETARLADLAPGSHVLDVGSGIGGPSRHLATAFGLRVAGVDLCAPYCEVATDLARRTGLSDRVAYHHGDATSLPFPDASFDASWTQHASMNIEDKPALYREMARVVKPGGRVVIYDIHGTDGPAPHFPVPWARVPELSFLCTADGIRAHLASQGLEPLEWRDDSAAASAWFLARMKDAAERGPQPLGLHVLLGPDWPAMAANIARNLDEGRIAVLQTVWKKP